MGQRVALLSPPQSLLKQHLGCLVAAQQLGAIALLSLGGASAVSPTKLGLELDWNTLRTAQC